MAGGFESPLMEALKVIAGTGNNPEAYNAYKTDTQKYFLDNATLSKYAPVAAEFAVANPEAWQSKVSSYLNPKYGNLQDSTTNEYYDSPTNKWIKHTAASTSAPSTATDEPATTRSRSGYSYGTENPYLNQLLGVKGKSPDLSRYQLEKGKRQGMKKKPEFDFINKLLGK